MSMFETRHTVYRWGFAAFLMISGICGICHADGIMMPPMVAPHMPEMPSQRAIVAYRDGVETLVVESAFKGAGKEMAWILPVPATPTEIAKATPGLFTVLQLNLQPEVVDSDFGIVCAGLFMLVWAIFNLDAGRPALWVSFGMTLLMFSFFLFAYYWTRAQFLSAGMDSAAQVEGVRASEASYVGDYEVKVLEAASPESLGEWLATNGFKDIPEAGKPIVADYITNGWKFVAAKLLKDSDGLTKPHPIMLTFPTDKPVYPMRLTKLAGSDLYLDLFVIAKEKMGVARMEMVDSVRFRINKDEDIPTESRVAGNRLDGRRIREDGYPLLLGLPSLLKLAGGDCTITWLRANLSPGDMDRDFYVSPADIPSNRVSVLTARGARFRAAGTALFAAGLLLLAGSRWAYSRFNDNRRGAATVPCFILAVWVGAATYAAVYFLTPKAELLKTYRKDDPASEAIAQLRAYPDITKKMAYEDIKGYLTEALAGAQNPFTKEPLRLEEVPGGLDLVQKDECIIAVTYDFGGTPEEHYLVGSPVKKRLQEFRDSPDKTEILRDEVAKELSALGWDIIPKVRELVKDSDPQMRYVALEGIRQFVYNRSNVGENAWEGAADRRQEIGTMMTEFLGDSDARMREEAVIVLGQLGLTFLIPQIAGMIDDSDEGVAEAAIQALEDLRVGKDILPVLMPHLVATERDAILKRALAAIGSLREDAAEAVPALISMLKENKDVARDPKIRLNEIVIMGSETKDEDGEPQDWIELYNEYEQRMDLKGWTLTDDRKNPKRWTFAESTPIEPSGYLLVYASGKNRAMHANFTLNDKGGELALYDPSGALVDEMEFTAGTPGWSYCYFEDEGTNARCSQVLATIGMPALDPLLAALRDPSHSVAGRAMAARTIGHFGPSAARALPDLLAEYDKSEVPVRSELLMAATFVGKNAPEVISRLIAASNDENARIRTTAMAALNNLDGQKYPPPPENRWSNIFDELKQNTNLCREKRVPNIGGIPPL